MKIGQYLTKLCVDYVGLLFLAHPVYWYMYIGRRRILLQAITNFTSCPSAGVFRLADNYEVVR